MHVSLPPGCTLKSDKREFKVDVDDDDTEQQLSLKAVRNILIRVYRDLCSNECQNTAGEENVMTDNDSRDMSKATITGFTAL